MLVLVTGGLGAVGAYLVRELRGPLLAVVHLQLTQVQCQYIELDWTESRVWILVIAGRGIARHIVGDIDGNP